MARWCLVMNQPADLYQRLTRVQREAFVDAYNELHRKR